MVLIGSIASALIGLLIWFIKKYFDRTDKNQEDTGKILVGLARIETTQEDFKKDFGRIEGSVESLRKTMTDHTTSIIEHSLKIEALFRFADGANQRATDINKLYRKD